jgi:single-strand DNA-binding protein
MANLNKVFLMGNLTRDPELRYTPSGSPVCQFGMAINRVYKTSAGEQREEVCFVDVVMWGQRGVVISEYFTKGRPIFIEGRLQYDSWETPEGRRNRLRVVAENFEFVGGRGPGGGDDRAPAERPQRGRSAPRGGAAPERQGSQESAPEPQEETYDVGEDEIPF